MKGLIIGDVKELFSKDECRALALSHGFRNDVAPYEALNKLYSLFKMYSGADKPLTKSAVRQAFGAISSNADKLIKSLDIPLFESAVLHSRLDTDREALIGILERLSENATHLQDAVADDQSGRRMWIQNEFILGLVDLYEKGTGLLASAISYNPANDEDQQYQGKSLSFISVCLVKAEIKMSDGAIVQLIKRNQKHK